MSQKKQDESQMTVRAVVAYAAMLRMRANAARVRDPHVELYAPSEKTARNLCSQFGPAGAKAKLAERALRADRRHEEEETRAQQGRERLRGVQLVVVGEERSAREQLSLGQRLDVALLGLSMQSDVSAAVVDGDVITSGKSSGGGMLVSRRDRERAGAVEDAVRAVERLERELDRSRRRLIERAA